MYYTEFGKFRYVKLLQFSNALFSMILRLVENVISYKFEQFPKIFSPIVVTLFGRIIYYRLEHPKNAYF